MKKIWFTFALVATTLLPLSVYASSAPQAAGKLYDKAAASLVPQEVRQKGQLTIATDATYPPFESVSTKGEIVGFDADLAKAIAATLGLKVHMVNVPFDSIIPGLAAHKYDIAMSSIGDTKARQKIVDFVTYYRNQTNAMVQKGNPHHLATNALCGARVAVERGSLQQATMLPQLSKNCVQAGKPPVQPQVYNTSNLAKLALSSGRVDAVLADAISQDRVAAKSQGRFVTVGPPMHNDNPGGVAIPKNSGLAEPIQAALRELMRNGTYQRIVERWNMQTVAIHTPQLNAAIN